MRNGSSKDVGSSFTSFVNDVECYEVEKSQVGMRGGMRRRNDDRREIMNKGRLVRNLVDC